MSPKYKLICGNLNYSSWSVRASYYRRAIEFASGMEPKSEIDEEVIFMFQVDTKEKLKGASPTMKVPCMVDLREGRQVSVWDSMAVITYLRDRYSCVVDYATTDSVEAQAICLSAAMEMHSSFMAVRKELPQNLRKPHPLNFEKDLSEQCQNECKRIQEVWRACLEASGGPYLAGKSPGIVDAMYVPIVGRFHTYSVPVEEGPALDYYNHILEKDPIFKQIVEEAKQEKCTLDFVDNLLPADQTPIRFS
eukprot:Clim_evm4s29 gene=Clim_evmTU4s29